MFGHPAGQLLIHEDSALFVINICHFFLMFSLFAIESG